MSARSRRRLDAGKEISVDVRFISAHRSEGAPSGKSSNPLNEREKAQEELYIRQREQVRLPFLLDDSSNIAAADAQRAGETRQDEGGDQQGKEGSRAA